MKKRILLSFVFIFSITIGFTQNLEEVLNHHYAAKNQKGLSEVENIHIVSKVQRLALSFAVEIWQERPDKMRMEVMVSGQKTIQVYDGERAYVIAPQQGVTAAQEVFGEQLKQISEQADIDGELVNWKEKGYTLTLEGKENFDNTEVYILKLVKEQGQEFNYYIDGETYLPIKMTGKYLDKGKMAIGESYYSKYKLSQNIMMPFLIENKMNGVKSNSIIIEKVEYNVDLPENFFTKP